MKILDISAKASYGFYATTEAPYLFLDRNANNNIIIARQFSKQTYSPLELNVYTTFQMTKTISLKAEYIYSNTYFYKSNYAGIGIKKNFLNENK